MGDWGQVQSLAHYAVILVAVGTTTFVSHWFRRRSKPRALVEGGGRIAPGRRAIGTGVVSGLLLSALGCTALWYGAIVPGSLMAASGLGGALLVALSLSPRHELVWSDTGIEGPCRKILGILGRARTQIRWGEIALTGRTLGGYAFVEAADGRRIYWSSYYSGFVVFETRLKLHRPDLFGEEMTRRPSGTTTLGNIGPRTDSPSRPVIEVPVIEVDAAPAGAPDIQPGSPDRGG